MKILKTYIKMLKLDIHVEKNVKKFGYFIEVSHLCIHYLNP